MVSATAPFVPALEPAILSPRACAAPTMKPSADPAWPVKDSRLRWYAYARVAWWHLLSALRLQPGDNILMPDLICDVMTEPLRRLGLQPRYYAAEPLGAIEAGELDEHFDRRTRAVLAVHYFGLPTDMSEAASFCQEMAVPLVEDASQAMLSRDPLRPIGHYGSAVLFSFRKTLRLPHGAGLLCNDPVLADAVDAAPVDLPKPRRDVWRYWIKRLDGRWLGGRCERLLDSIRARRGDLVRAGLCEPGEHPLETGGRSSADPFEPCLVQSSRSARWLTSRWDVQHEIHRRRKRFAQLADKWQAEDLPGRPLLTTLPEGWVPYAFVLEPDDSDAEQTCRNLGARGLAAEPWPRLPEDVPADVAARRKVLLIV